MNLFGTFYDFMNMNLLLMIWSFFLSNDSHSSRTNFKDAVSQKKKILKMHSQKMQPVFIS